jgi:hypothetical protein
MFWNGNFTLRTVRKYLRKSAPGRLNGEQAKRCKENLPNAGLPGAAQGSGALVSAAFAR